MTSVGGFGRLYRPCPKLLISNIHHGSKNISALFIFTVFPRRCTSNTQGPYALGLCDDMRRKSS